LVQKYIVGDWFNDVVHPMGSFRYCYMNGNCPIGESISSRIINLPVNISKKLNVKDITKIAEIIKDQLKQK
jgi:dTDP-4-amino-4,6-dideoxygalactose transaminase